MGIFSFVLAFLESRNTNRKGNPKNHVRKTMDSAYGGKLQDDVIIVLLHQMVVLGNRIEDSYNYCVCVLLRMGL